MSHNNTVILALSPFRKNATFFQKTLTIHDFYGLRTMQCRGKVKPQMLQGKDDPILRTFPEPISERSLDFRVMSEDLPDPTNRVTVDEVGRIHPARRLTNMDAFSTSVGGFAWETIPKTSVVDQWCRSQDVPNLLQASSRHRRP